MATFPTTRFAIVLYALSIAAGLLSAFVSLWVGAFWVTFCIGGLVGSVERELRRQWEA